MQRCCNPRPRLHSSRAALRAQPALAFPHNSFDSPFPPLRPLLRLRTPWCPWVPPPTSPTTTAPPRCTGPPPRANWTSHAAWYDAQHHPTIQCRAPLSTNLTSGPCEPSFCGRRSADAVPAESPCICIPCLTHTVSPLPLPVSLGSCGRGCGGHQRCRLDPLARGRFQRPCRRGRSAAPRGAGAGARPHRPGAGLNGGAGGFQCVSAGGGHVQRLHGPPLGGAHAPRRRRAGAMCLCVCVRVWCLSHAAPSYAGRGMVLCAQLLSTLTDTSPCHLPLPCPCVGCSHSELAGGGGRQAPRGRRRRHAAAHGVRLGGRGGSGPAAAPPLRRRESGEGGWVAVAVAVGGSVVQGKERVFRGNRWVGALTSHRFLSLIHPLLPPPLSFFALSLSLLCSSTVERRWRVPSARGGTRRAR